MKSAEECFYFILDPKLRALEVEGGSTADNANVQVHPFHAGDKAT